jgi:hypothetical protein
MPGDPTDANRQERRDWQASQDNRLQNCYKTTTELQQNGCVSVAETGQFFSANGARL